MNEIGIPDQLAGEWQHALFLTYGVEIPLFEGALWRQLAPGCRNKVILADGQRFLAACSSYAQPGLVRHLNHLYVADGVLHQFSVHAKAILLTNETSGRLMVGSGNLGMQGIAHFFGGQVVRANVPMHGKTSPIRHDGQGVYQGLPQQLDIMRYHSLMVDAASLPECLVVTSVVSSEQHSDKNLKDASLAGDEIMGIRHRDYPIQGVQYHPESFATEGAKMLLKNFLWHN